MGERQFMFSQTYKIHEEHSEAKTEDLTHAPPVSPVFFSSSFILFSAVCCFCVYAVEKMVGCVACVQY